jgi:hypothetical protein
MSEGRWGPYELDDPEAVEAMKELMDRLETVIETMINVERKKLPMQCVLNTLVCLQASGFSQVLQMTYPGGTMDDDRVMRAVLNELITQSRVFTNAVGHYLEKGANDLH